MSSGKTKKKIVYVIGAGLSAGLGFPTIGNLLPRMWGRLKRAGLANELADVIRFHHPYFNATLEDTFPNIEQLLSEMQANEQLFESSRPATGDFDSEKLRSLRQKLLLEVASWFHELQSDALRTPAPWLAQLCDEMKKERAQVISFNWDLVLDELLFGDSLDSSCYGFDDEKNKVRLIKPHGSLNWYESQNGRFLKEDLKFSLAGNGKKEVFAFRPYRAPFSTKRTYMPLIVPPVYSKQFKGETFKRLWQETVAIISTASEVRFLGYSLALADFHARFILRCGFHNQVEGALDEDGDRLQPTGRSRVLVVDPCSDGSVSKRIDETVGWNSTFHQKTIEQWMATGYP